MMKLNHPTPRKLLAVLACLAACLLSTAQAGNQSLSSPLSPKGELLLWTFADKIVLPQGKANLEQVLKDELIAGEASLAPVGGEKFTCANRDYTWGTVKLIDGFYGLVNDEPAGGKPLDYSAAYLYCVLESETSQNLNLVLRSDDAPKVYLDGKLVFSKYCQRGIQQEKDEVPLALKKGPNKLLIRVDNYLGGCGFYAKLLGQDGQAATGVKTVVEAGPKVKVWDYKNSMDFQQAYLALPSIPEEPFEAYFGARIQRTMTLLESSTPTRRNKVKILFYGQSIVAEGWHRLMVKKLQARYPYAIIEAENRAIGGHTAPVLVRCAAQDLYPFYPDLVVFHVYNGVDSGELERIFYNIRKFTTAEILTFSHHYCRVPRDMDYDESQFYKYLAQKYDCEFVNVHEEWGKYLKLHNLEPGQLLSDGIHHNGLGFLVIQEMLMKHFKFNTLFRGGWYDRVKTLEARRFFEEKQDEIMYTGSSWKSKGHGWGVAGTQAGDRLRLEFTGNRLDITVPPRAEKKPFGTAAVLIDGKNPSELSSVYTATRPSKDIVKSRPAIKRVTLGANPIAEEWTFKITEVSDDCRRFSYSVTGSVTGPDGTGTNRATFTSNSGRITLEPRDLAPFYNKRKKMDNMLGFEVKWNVIAQCEDTWKPQPTADQAVANTTTLVQGLSNGAHTLELILNGDGQVPFKSITVHTPPIK
jgi:hypothetical protein